MWEYFWLIPVEVTASVVFSFFNASDLARLESALGSSRRIATFRQMLSHVQTVHLESYGVDQTEFCWEWFWKREITVDRIIFDGHTTVTDHLHDVLSYVHRITLCVGDGWNADVNWTFLQNAAFALKVDVLDIYGSDVEVGEEFLSMRSLKDITFRNTTDADCAQLIAANNQLDSITLHQTSVLPVAVWNAIGLRGSALFYLDVHISSCTEAALIAIGTLCSELRELVIQGENNDPTEVTSELALTVHSARAIAQGCCKLQVLQLSAWEVCNPAVVEVFAVHCRCLRKLVCSLEAALTDATLVALARNCPNLVDLTAAMSFSRGAVWQAMPLFCRLVRWSTLCADEIPSANSRVLCYAIDSSAFKMGDLSRLRDLTVHVTGVAAQRDVLSALAEHCTTLEHFTLINPHRAKACREGSELVDFAQANRQLATLSLHVARNIPADVLLQATVFCPLLITLHVTVEDGSELCFITLCQHCPRLQRIGGAGLLCSFTTDASLLALAEHCPRLETVNLGNCSQVTEAAVETLLRRCSKLECVNVPRSWSKGAVARIQAIGEVTRKLCDIHHQSWYEPW